jgi:chromosome segregation ATPase
MAVYKKGYRTMIDDLKDRQARLAAQKRELEKQLEDASSALERLVDGPENPRDTARLVQLEQESASLTAARDRTDRALGAVGRELQAENATAATAARHDLIEDAARSATAATAEEQRRYDDLTRDLERIFVGILSAAEHGQDARRQLRNLLKTAAPALTVLGSPTAYGPAREDEAEQLEGSLSARGVDLRAALEPEARFRFAGLLPFITEWSATRPLESA